MAASGGDDLVADGVADEVGCGMQMKFVHDVGPVRIHRLDADAERDQVIPFTVALARGSVSQVGGGEHMQGPLVIDGAEDGAECGRFQ